MSFDLKDFIKRRTDKTVFTGLPLTIFIIVFLILLATFLGLTDAIVNSAPLVKVDDAFEHFLYSKRTPELAQIFYIITNFANQITIAILGIASVAYLYFKKEFDYLYGLVIVLLGTDATVYIMKILINRVRPGADIAYYLESSKSFPSGHSAIAMAFFGFVIYYLIRHMRSRKLPIILFGSILIGLIGFSRLYLGVHFLSDVIGGFVMGALWLSVAISFRERNFYLSSLKKLIKES